MSKSRGVSWVGVDIAKRSFVAAQRSGSEIQIANFEQTLEGFAAFGRSLRTGSRIVLESSGPYWRPLAEWLQSQAIPYACLNPRRVRDFARACETPNKTDEVDAVVLLRFAETLRPAMRRARPGVWLQLRALWRHHRDLQQLLDTTRDRRDKALADPQIPAALAHELDVLLDHLQRQLQTLQAHTLQLLHRHRKPIHAYRLLLSIPGIGPKTALTLLTEYGPTLLIANPKQMTRYAGLNPVLWLSGTSVHRPPQISHQGNRRIRHALYMAALVASCHNPPLRAFYQRKLAQGLPKLKALVAVMRKLLHLCYGVLRHQQPFNPNLHNPLTMPNP